MPKRFTKLSEKCVDAFMHVILVAVLVMMVSLAYTSVVQAVTAHQNLNMTSIYETPSAHCKREPGRIICIAKDKD